MWSIICVTGVIGEEREDWAEKNMKKKQNKTTYGFMKLSKPHNGVNTKKTVPTVCRSS